MSAHAIGSPRMRKAIAALTLMSALAVGACNFDLRSEEHTSELQSPCNLVCRLLLEKKKRASRRSSSFRYTELHSRISDAIRREHRHALQRYRPASPCAVTPQIPVSPRHACSDSLHA